MADLAASLRQARDQLELTVREMVTLKMQHSAELAVHTEAME